MNQRQAKKIQDRKAEALGKNKDIAKENVRNQRDFGRCEVKSVVNEKGEEVKTYDLSFSSEDPYCRWFWNDAKKEFEFIPEILSHDEGAVEYERLKNLGTVLFNHNRDVPIAHIEDVKIENKRGVAVVKFGSDEESQKYREKVDSGVLKGVSVGYLVNEYKRIKNYDYHGTKTDAMVATKWSIYEISIVSVPADATVGVGRELDIEEPKKISYEFYEKQLEINRRK